MGTLNPKNGRREPEEPWQEEMGTDDTRILDVQPGTQLYVSPQATEEIFKFAKHKVQVKNILNGAVTLEVIADPSFEKDAARTNSKIGQTVTLNRRQITEEGFDIVG